MFNLDPGQMAGLGAGMGEFGKQFVSTDLARRRLALYEQGQEIERRKAEERRKLLEDEREAERKRREIEEKQEAEARERETNLLRDHAIPYLKEKGGKEWAWITPEMAGDLPFKQIWNDYVASRRFERRVPTVKTPASAIMTREKALRLIENNKHTSYKATDGNTYVVYEQWAIDMAGDWNIPRKNMRTIEDVEQGIQKIRKKEEVKGKKPLIQEIWEAPGQIKKFVTGQIGKRLKPSTEMKSREEAEAELRAAGASEAEIKQILDEKYGVK